MHNITDEEAKESPGKEYSEEKELNWKLEKEKEGKKFSYFLNQ